MVLSEGFKDILNLKYILKVIFSSNYVIMVGLLAKAESHSHIRPNEKQQEPWAPGALRTAWSEAGVVGIEGCAAHSPFRANVRVTTGFPGHRELHS